MTAKVRTPPMKGAYQSEDVSEAMERIVTGAKPMLPELGMAVVYKESQRQPPSPYAEGAWSIDLREVDDHQVWALTARCWGAHNRLGQELERVGGGRNAATIIALGDDRRQALLELARTTAQSLHGVVWKKDVLLLFLDCGDEAAVLLSSCLRDCDRLLGTEVELKLQDIEPCLPRALACVVEIEHHFACEADRYDDFDSSGQEEQRAAIVSRIETLSSQLETAISVVSQSSAMTLVGLTAKLRLYERCAERGGTMSGQAALRRSMFDDLDRLVRQQAAMRGLPAPEERLRMV